MPTMTLSTDMIAVRVLYREEDRPVPSNCNFMWTGNRPLVPISGDVRRQTSGNRRSGNHLRYLYRVPIIPLRLIPSSQRYVDESSVYTSVFL